MENDELKELKESVYELLKYGLSDEYIKLKLFSKLDCSEDEANIITEVKEIISAEHIEYKKQYAKQYYLNNKERTKIKQKEYNKNNKGLSKKRSRKHTVKKYGLTLEQYNNLLNSQNQRCSICGRHQDELKQSLAVDHDHVSGKVRGLLCVRCNRAIGMLEDDIKLLKQAINYLSITVNNNENM